MRTRFLTFFLLCATAATAQITIDQNDMPVPGDTIRRSGTTIQNFDPGLTGANYTWDFSALTYNNQQVDTFVNVTDAPLVYNVAFNSPLDTAHKATSASPQADQTLMGTIQLTEVFFFYKCHSAQYKQVGQAATINGIPAPVKYNDPELLFTFPVTYGSVDSSYTEYGMAIPTLGYYGQQRHRTNYVDGWGTLATPYGTFPVMRVRSELRLHDSVYYDAMGMGFAFDREETEIKWMGDDFGLPLLQVTVSQQGGARALYIDSVRTTNNAVAEHQALRTFSVYPNPTSDEVTFSLPAPLKAGTRLQIMDVTGRVVFTRTLTEAETRVRPGLPAGTYSVIVEGYLPGLLVVE